jgi:hypothetical protein
MAVHERVQHLQAVMAHADRVHVRKRHTQLAADGTMIFADHVQFAADVLGRLQNARQNEPRDEIFQFDIKHVADYRRQSTASSSANP